MPRLCFQSGVAFKTIVKFLAKHMDKDSKHCLYDIQKKNEKDKRFKFEKPKEQRTVEIRQNLFNQKQVLSLKKVLSEVTES